MDEPTAIQRATPAASAAAAVGTTPWTSLLDSIRRRRWPGALYYKPACLIAVIDGIDAGELDPQHIDAEGVLRRFHTLVSHAAPSRADYGWRPFWHLSNDGAWSFYRGGRRVLPDDYGKERKPNSKGELLNRIDRVVVADTALSSWRSPTERAALKHALIEMLKRDGIPACSRLAEVAVGTFADLPPVEARSAGDHEQRGGQGRQGGQGFLSSAEARSAIDRQAMAVATSHLQRLGWTVIDVSATRSYDLDCLRCEDKAFVEVKGTTSTGRNVLLTAGEVAFAQQHTSHMVLALVTGIRLSHLPTGDVIAVGGTLRLIWRWSPELAALTPLKFTYEVPAET